jgi:hypothetical protein
MSIARTLTFAAVLIACATGAAAQTPVTSDGPGPMPGAKTENAVQPVMDQAIFAHLLFNQLEGRWNRSNTEFRWTDRGGWAPTTTSCGSNRRAR